MTESDVTKILTDMKHQIRQITMELKEFIEPEILPEFIESANLIRTNNYLFKTNQKKSELLAAYGEYSDHLESIISTVFEIYSDLQEILKIQSVVKLDHKK